MRGENPSCLLGLFAQGFVVQAVTYHNEYAPA